MPFFTSRLVSHFAGLPLQDQLFEVVTPDGERVGSATDSLSANDLADRLNTSLKTWEGENVDHIAEG